MYLSENGYIEGDEATDALAWADERREQLLIRQEERRLPGATSAVQQMPTQAQVQVLQAEDDKMIKAVSQLVFLLRCIVCVLCVLCVVLVVKK